MWIISKKFTFEAAHRLPHHDGKCAKLHGHSWEMTIYIKGSSLIKAGAKQDMIMDYGDIKKVVKPIVEIYLDHQYLNESLGLENPTSEKIALWVYEKIEPYFSGLVGVKINETCTSSCFYTKNPNYIILS